MVDDKLLTRKKPAIKQINSHLISAVFEHGGAELKGPFKKPAEITLNRLHVRHIRCSLSRRLQKSKNREGERHFSSNS